MLNICCVKSGGKYGPEYVNILFDMVRRNLPEGLPGRFVCLTDDPTGLDEGIQTVSLPDFVSGWWAKLYLFSPNLFPEGERVLYLDLDVVVTGPLDELANYSGDFAILKDWWRNGWQSSIMAFRAGYGNHIWNEWLEDNKPEIPGGDQEWIQFKLRSAEILQDLFPNSFYSYKAHSLHENPPQSSKIVIFHGEPKPHECLDSWVGLIWKIGGGSAAELEIICNTEKEAIKNNIKSACSLDIPWLDFKDPHDGHAVIVGGAPSLKTKIDEIRWRQGLGHKIFALNGSFSFLQDSGIEPDYQVIVDAREQNTQFVPLVSKGTHYFASQCDPLVFELAKELDVVLWHPNLPFLYEALENSKGHDEVLLNCGTTVGLAAMAIAYAQGFRFLHIYGMDSSLEGHEHHAYTQSLNDGDKVVDVICQGRTFRATAWMIAQANQFQILAADLANAGCTITVHGHGLLPWIATQMSNATLDTEIEEYDGDWWPSKDVEGRLFIMSSIEDISLLLQQCRGRDVVVQAGGNVGIWPREFAKHFNKVITFEPDELNFRCLELNLNGSGEKVERFNAALGDRLEKVGLARNPYNCGAHQVINGDDIQTMTIDSLNLDKCDLIQLDIEGYELRALKGGEETIKKFKPTICLELKKLGEKYGDGDDKVLEYLEGLGYFKAIELSRDVVFLPKI